MNEKQAGIFGAVIGVLVSGFAIIGFSLGFIEMTTVKKFTIIVMPIVVIVGSVGTYREIKKAKSPQQRRFAIQNMMLFLIIPAYAYVFIFVDFPYKVFTPILMIIFAHKWSSWMKKKKQEIDACEQNETMPKESKA